MKGKRVDVITLTQSFNKFRMEHQSKTYTREELLNELNKLGMNSAIATMFIAKCIPSEKVGFNLEKFKAENPVLYKKYLKYEVV